MHHIRLVAAGALALAILSSCGEHPQLGVEPTQGAGAAPSNLQQVAFTGIAEPALGRVQIITGPQATFGLIPEDADGNAATATADTAQVYGASAGFTSTPSQYPAGCNPGAPLVMFADVEVLSGFKEQLRNVYARMTAMSSGPSFCTATTSGAYGGWLDPNFGLYLYQPLDAGADPASAIRRTVQWGLNLPDNSAFWFKGELWAEVIPQPPANLLPADAVVIHTGGTSRANVAFSWTDDPLADGTNPEGYAVARPAGGASISILRCGSASKAFDPATCTSTILNPRLVTSGSYTRSLWAGRWYQWSLRTSFLLPGDTTRTLGSAIATRHFSVVSP